MRKTGELLPMKNGMMRFKIKDGRVVEALVSGDTHLTTEVLA